MDLNSAIQDARYQRCSSAHIDFDSGFEYEAASCYRHHRCHCSLHVVVVTVLVAAVAGSDDLGHIRLYNAVVPIHCAASAGNAVANEVDSDSDEAQMTEIEHSDFGSRYVAEHAVALSSDSDSAYAVAQMMNAAATAAEAVVAPVEVALHFEQIWKAMRTAIAIVPISDAECRDLFCVCGQSPNGKNSTGRSTSSCRRLCA